MPTQALGWVSSAVLVLTIGAQLRKQWSSGTSEGVSPLLFVGQAVASTGLLIFSVLGEQHVFAVLNAIMCAAAVAGLGIWMRCRRLDQQREPSLGGSVVDERAVRPSAART